MFNGFLNILVGWIICNLFMASWIMFYSSGSDRTMWKSYIATLLAAFFLIPGILLSGLFTKKPKRRTNLH